MPHENRPGPSELTPEEIELRREAALKKLLATPHKPHKKGAGPKPDASRFSEVEGSHERSEPVKRGGKAK